MALRIIYIMFDPNLILEYLFASAIVRELLPFVLFVVLLFLFHEFWLAYVQEKYRSAIKWSVIELRIPREAKRPPKAMEQVFMAIHAVKNSPDDFAEWYVDGEIPMWFSCEAVSFGGEVHFFMRVPTIRKNHIEAALYSQYPDIEIANVEDYIDRLPPNIVKLTEAGYRLFGNELVLNNKDVYPIMTYQDFEAPVEEKELDPVGALLETLSRLKPQENIWMQILLRPLTGSYITQFHKDGENEIKDIQERTGKRKMFSPQFGEFVMIDRAPGDVEQMKVVDRKIEKPTFEVVLRYLYIAPKEIYNPSFGRRSVLMAVNQYASETYNKFKHNTKAWTLARVWYFPFIFPKRRAKARQERMYKNYRDRTMWVRGQETFMTAILRMKFFDWGFRPRRFGFMRLNTEELATIFHPPTQVVLTGPLIKREEARKMGPPAGLPIYGEGGEELPLKK